jgi:hypothetical protein
LDRRLGGPQSQSGGRGGEEKSINAKRLLLFKNHKISINKNPNLTKKTAKSIVTLESNCVG